MGYVVGRSDRAIPLRDTGLLASCGPILDKLSRTAGTHAINPYDTSDCDIYDVQKILKYSALSHTMGTTAWRVVIA